MFCCFDWSREINDPASWLAGLIEMDGDRLGVSVAGSSAASTAGDGAGQHLHRPGGQINLVGRASAKEDWGWSGKLQIK
jgi:hypothetical protein